MSTFDGIVTEIPFIRVDNFTDDPERATLFFLSHCHTDHMKGLDDDFFDNLKRRKLFLFGSPISIRILKNRYTSYEDQLKEVHVDEPTLLETDYKGSRQYLNVFVIPAGHCPGSVMFLFENNSIRVLYTGDFRIDKKEQFMRTYFKERRLLNNLYLDTTFCNVRFKHFPSREETLQGLCNIIKNWLNLDIKNVVAFELPANYGSEFLFIEIFKKTRQIIHVSDIMHNLHKFIPDMDGIVQGIDNNQNIRIHSCQRNMVNSICKLSHTPDKYICTIKITAMIWEDYRIGDAVAKHENGNKYRVCASYHPSYSELCDFVKYLKPVTIVPCVVPKNEQEKREMLQLLEDMLSFARKTDEIENFAVDEAKMLKVSKFHRKCWKRDDILSSPPRNFSPKRIKR